jgi:methylphosphotriester-DNA--protein-cysteine methyltransferase
VDDSHRVVFHSEVEAVAAGYRACKICRPALIA